MCNRAPKACKLNNKCAQIFSTPSYFGIPTVPLISSAYILPTIHQYTSQQGSKGHLSQLYKEGECAFKTPTQGDQHKREDEGGIHGNLSMLGFPTAAEVITLDWEGCTKVSWFLPPVFCPSLPPSSSVWYEGLAVRTTSEGRIKATHMDIWTYSMIFSHIHIHYSLHTSSIYAVSYLVLGFAQLVLQFRETEASDSDEVTDHCHKLIPTFPRPALLVVQLLEGKGGGQRRDVWFSKEKTGYEILVCFIYLERKEVERDRGSDQWSSYGKS